MLNTLKHIGHVHGRTSHIGELNGKQLFSTRGRFFKNLKVQIPVTRGYQIFKVKKVAEPEISPHGLECNGLSDQPKKNKKRRQKDGNKLLAYRVSFVLFVVEVMMEVDVVF